MATGWVLSIDDMTAKTPNVFIVIPTPIMHHMLRSTPWDTGNNEVHNSEMGNGNTMDDIGDRNNKDSTRAVNGGETINTTQDKTDGKQLDSIGNNNKGSVISADINVCNTETSSGGTIQDKRTVNNS